MDTEEKKGRELNREEQEEMRLGFDLEDMTSSPGWKIFLGWLEQRAYHSWVDPRIIEGDDPKGKWEWQELNAFHSADVAKQLIEDVEKAVNRAHYLKSVELGEIKEAQRMRL
jgi:hypothetical protein